MKNLPENETDDSMEELSRHINIGLVAHVDAGKTTLSECMLYVSGAIRKLGRVDHQNAFLDTYELERARGITIFSKQAAFTWKGTDITLLDTPGHVDFSAEMERTLQVLDYAVLIISGADGIQGHTETLWRLLDCYQIPVFVFVNKMDQDGADRGKLTEELKKRFGEACVDLTELSLEEGEIPEELAVCDEKLLDEYLESGTICKETLREMIAKRKVFPCYFGSALRVEGVKELLDAIVELSVQKSYPEGFGAKVYKISRDGQGNRLTYLKVTGGVLRVRSLLGETQEKVNQIRLYSGEKYETVSALEAGRVCAVTGPEETYPGQGVGNEPDSDMPVLEPVLTYRVKLPDEYDAHTMLRNLRQLEEEEPELHIVWEEKLSEIHLQLMGEVQIDILRQMIKDRFGVRVDFDEGSIVYKETIAEPVEGVGHFEPLRHYAEVHLLLEPGERGSGMQYASDCSEDVLDRNWQRLILTHLEEKEHVGVLTGAAVTDMKITLLSGRAHQKHTEGGDFRQATYRAVRQGLKKAESLLLEPFYEFRLEMPAENVGRAMSDIQKMYGTFTTPESDGMTAVLSGSAPVSTMRGYQTEFAAYTGGRGRMSCTLKGYDICHNAAEVAAAAGYDSESDTENPTGSVFCAHGAGFVVPWYEVEDYMHVENRYHTGEEAGEKMTAPVRKHASSSGIELTQEELDAIYVRTPDPAQNRGTVTVHAMTEDRGNAAGGKWSSSQKKKEEREEYLLVDGYNVIFAWEELKKLAERNVEGARGKLADILCNYQGWKKCTLILVFDAYRVEGNPGEVIKYHNIYIVYTKEAETADEYIEKTVRRIAKSADVTVATSDGLEQVIILGQGAQRMSAGGLREEIETALSQMREEHLGKHSQDRNYLFNYLSQDDLETMEKIRLGEKSS